MLYILIFLALIVTLVYLFIKFIVKRDHGHREPLHAYFIAVGFGFVAVFLAGFLNETFVSENIFNSIANKSTFYINAPELMLGALTIGVIEESLKCIPFAIFIYSRKYFDELTDGAIYFGIVALTFGVIEHITYAMMLGSGTGITRAIFAPYLHAGFTIFFGMALAYKKILNKSWWLVFFGYSSAVMLHAIYDYFAFSLGFVGTTVVFMLTIFLNIFLFVLFRKAQSDDEKRGQSAIGINKFCRHCGRPNPKKLLYCSHCGKLS
jgi:RsiW-degrading membrane proteinase PrsW (M82 family)